jgi:hypothetical protein
MWSYYVIAATIIAAETQETLCWQTLTFKLAKGIIIQYLGEPALASVTPTMEDEWQSSGDECLVSGHTSFKPKQQIIDLTSTFFKFYFLALSLSSTTNSHFWCCCTFRCSCRKPASCFFRHILCYFFFRFFLNREVNANTFSYLLRLFWYCVNSFKCKFTLNNFSIKYSSCLTCSNAFFRNILN